MMLEKKQINDLLGITESYKAPEVMLSMVLNEHDKISLFDQFLEIEQDLSYEWF